MQISYFFRKPKPHYHSIERVFNQLIQHLPSQIEARKYTLKRGDKGVLDRLWAMWDAYRAKGVINHITGDISYLAIALPKKGLVVTFHDLESLERRNAITSALLKWIWVILPARRAEKITVISEHTKGKLMEWVKLNPDKVTVIPNPLPAGFEFSAYNFNVDCPVVLAMGTKVNKNLEGIIEAIKDMRCKLIIVGQLFPHQVRLLQLYNIQFENFEKATNEQIIELYKRCDLLCFPSYFEGFGIPILEAQAIGRPVITSGVGAMPQTAGERGALFVDPSEVDEIKNALIRLVRENELRDDLIENGIANAAKYEITAIAQKYAAVYQQIRSAH